MRKAFSCPSKSHWWPQASNRPLTGDGATEPNHVFQGPWTTLSPAENWPRPLGYINSTKIWRLPQCLQQPRVGRGLKWDKTAFTSPSDVSRSPVLFGKWHRLSSLTATKMDIEYPLKLDRHILRKRVRIIKPEAEPGEMLWYPMRMS